MKVKDIDEIGILLKRKAQ